MTPTEYRQTRAAIRDTSSLALDELDGLYSALVHGDAPRALQYARGLAEAADDLTALCERIVSGATREAQSLAGSERSAQ